MVFVTSAWKTLFLITLRSLAPAMSGFRASDIFWRVFERIVGSCIEAGLVGGEVFAVDASLIESDANRQRSRNTGDRVEEEARSCSSQPSGEGVSSPR